MFVAHICESTGSDNAGRVLEINGARLALKDLDQIAVKQRHVFDLRRANREAVVRKKGILLTPADSHEKLGRNGVLHRDGAGNARQKLQKLAFFGVAIGWLSRRWIEPLLNEQTADLSAPDQRCHYIRGDLTANRQLQVGSRCAFFKRRQSIAPRVETHLVEQHVDVLLIPIDECLHRRRLIRDAGLDRQRAPRDESTLGRRQHQREPRGRLVSLMNVVIHQTRVSRVRNATARRRDVAFLNRAVLKIAQLVGGRAQQIDQHLVEIRFARGTPTRNTLGHGRHHGVAERLVVFVQVVDLRIDLRGQSGSPVRRAIRVETAGTKLEANIAE